MGAVVKMIDGMLLLFFVVMAIGPPIIDIQACFKVGDWFPKALVDFNIWYINQYNDYLYAEKPHFFMGLIWLELFFHWPLTIANVYAILSGKSWFPTTSLIYGASFTTTMVAILAELILSKRGSKKLLSTYIPLLGFAILATLRGLVTSRTTIVEKRHVLNTTKKKA